MSEPSNGITPELIRSFVPPYCLSQDLLAATIAAIAPPPPDAPQPWRHARITRLLEEIGAYHPADSAQARLVTQLLIVREAADTFAAGTYAPGLTPEQRCRLSRSAAEQRRGAEALERIITRHQQRPASFYGTVVPDGVDIPALDTIWRTAPPPHRRLPPPTSPSRPCHARPPPPPAHRQAPHRRTPHRTHANRHPDPSASRDRRPAPRVVHHQARGGPRLVPGGPPPPQRHHRAPGASRGSGPSPPPLAGGGGGRGPAPRHPGMTPTPPPSPDLTAPPPNHLPPTNRGDPNPAPPCGAKTRTGARCDAPAMPNGRCRLHGGLSTGPRTAKGRARMLAANTTHGLSTAPKRALHRYAQTLARRTRLTCAAQLLRAYLPPEMAARLSAGPEELWPSPHPSNLPFLQNREPTLRNPPPTSGAPPTQGAVPPGTAAPPSTATHPQSPGLAAERAAARAEAATLAPWREAIAVARAAQRAALQARRDQRATQSPATRPRPAQPRRTAPSTTARGKNENSGTNPAQRPKPATPPLGPTKAALLRTTTPDGPYHLDLASRLAKRFGPAPPPGWCIPQAMPPSHPAAIVARKFRAAPQPERPKPHPHP